MLLRNVAVKRMNVKTNQVIMKRPRALVRSSPWYAVRIPLLGCDSVSWSSERIESGKI